MLHTEIMKKMAYPLFYTKDNYSEKHIAIVVNTLVSSVMSHVFTDADAILHNFTGTTYL